MQQELKNKRGYHKIAFKEKGKYIERIYQTPIFYNNILGLGDGVKGYREIDHVLKWNSKKRAWTFEFNNYQPDIPEYADEWVKFRDIFNYKDHTISMRPIAQHVKGRLVEPIEGKTNGYQAVIYDNAFGQGIDLIIHPTATGIRKMIKISEKARPAGDAYFDFEIQADEDIRILKDREDDIKTDPIRKVIGEIPEAPKDIIAGNRLMIGSPVKGYTFIKPVRAWDSGTPGKGQGQKKEICKGQILEIEGKKIFRKIVPASFFDGAVGDIFTDDTTSVDEDKDTYYGTVYTTGGAPDAEFLNTGGWGDYYHSYIEWDLTGTPGAALTNKCNLKLKVYSVGNNDPIAYIRRVTSSWDEATLALANLPTDTTTDQVLLGNPLAIGVDNWLTTDITHFYKNWKAGTFSNYGIKLNTTYNTDAGGAYYSSDHATTAYRPYLEVGALYPSVSTDEADDITEITATANGEITDSSLSALIRRGFVYDTSAKSDPGDAEPDASGYANYVEETPAGNQISVQKGSYAMNAGSFYTYITLDTPVKVGESFAIMSVRGDNYYPAYTFGLAQLTTISNGYYTQILLYRSYTTSNAVYDWQVLTCADFKVQSGEAEMASLTQKDITISDIDQTASFVVLSSRNNTTGLTAGAVRGKFTSDTNLQLNCSVATTTHKVQYYVVEWAGSTVESGSFTFDGTVEASGTHDYTIDAVDLEKTFVLFSQSMANFSSNAGITMTELKLTSTTNLRLQKYLYNAGGEFGTVDFFVISHPNIRVQSGEVYIANGNLSGDGVLNPANPVDEDRTFAATAQYGNARSITNANSTNHYGYNTQKIADDETLTIARGNSTNDLYASYFAVEDQIISFDVEAYDLPLTGLTKGEEYFIRAFAENEYGIDYGSELNFLTLGIEITKGLAYSIDLGATDITKGLDYYAVLTTDINKTLAYEVQASIAIEKTLAYTILTIPAEITKGLDYTIIQAPAEITKGLVYEILTETDITKGLVYSVIQTPAEITKGLDYSILITPAEITKGLAYSILTDTDATKDLDYSILTSTEIQKSLTYEILTETAINKVVSYAVITETDITKGLIYAVVQTPAEITKSLAYAIIYPQEITKGLEYEIITEGAITKGLIYSVITEQAITKGLDYEIKTENAITKTLGYSTITQNDITKGAEYRVIAPSAITKGLTYAIKLESVINTGLAYSVKSTQETTLGAVYGVKTTQETTKGIEYRLYAVIAITKSLSYEIEAAIEITKGIAYRVISQESVELGLDYQVKINPYSKKDTPYSRKTGIYSKKTTPYTAYPKQ